MVDSSVTQPPEGVWGRENEDNRERERRPAREQPPERGGENDDNRERRRGQAQKQPTGGSRDGKTRTTGNGRTSTTMVTPMAQHPLNNGG